MKKLTSRSQKTENNERQAPASASSRKKPDGRAVTGAAGSKTGSTERSGHSSGLDSKQQTAMFEKAVRLFHARDFRRAKELFDKSSAGPMREMTYSARLHARMCESRLVKTAPSLATAEEQYNYAISLINKRELETAEQLLKKTLSQNPDGDHLYYALALCRGLVGDSEGAYTNLRRAIELHPRNRTLARNDSDFAELAGQPLMRELLFPERTASA